MYNRYIPEDVHYTPVEESGPPPAPGRGPGRAPFRLPELLSGKEGLSGLLAGRDGVLKALRLDRLDSGDILLLLLALYLLAEGDDPELALALGLTVLMDLGQG